MISRIAIVLRIIFILIMGYASAYLIINSEFWLAGTWLVLCTILGIVNLTTYHERSKRELQNFLEAIKQGDFSQGTLRQHDDKRFNYKKLYKEISGIFHQLNAEKASNHLFLQTVVEHINIAILAFDENKQTAISNDAIKKLFHIPQFKNMERLFRNHPGLLIKIKDGKQSNFSYKMFSEGHILKLAVKKTYFKIGEVRYTIVSFQDIRQELEENELDSWQKLIRTLTHEIMNSAIPISTLASVISQLMLDENGRLKGSINEEEKSDIFKGLNTIENRSKGLSQFVESYKNLTQLNPIKITKTELNQLIEEILILLKNELDQNEIEINYSKSNLFLECDKELLSQVIINLIKNSIEALYQKKNAKIAISTFVYSERTIIQISDNGSGINPEIMDDIFIPFYTTKENGSGIGLSLARQIIRMHRGKLSLRSDPAFGSEFKIEI